MANPPGPKGRFLLGSFPDYKKDRLGFLALLAREYGDIVFWKWGFRGVYFLNHPDHVRYVLVSNERAFARSSNFKQTGGGFLGPNRSLLTMDGRAHVDARKLLLPYLSRERVQSFVAVMAEHTQRRWEGWDDGGEIDLTREMLSLAMSFTAKNLLGLDLGRKAADDLMDSFNAVRRLFLPPTLSNPPTVPTFLYRLPSPFPRYRPFMRGQTAIEDLVYGLIASRRANGEDHGDLLSMLVHYQDDEEGNRLSDTVIRHEVVSFTTAGFTNMACIVHCALSVLSRHPEVQKKLREEYDTVLGGRLPTAADLEALSYTRKVLAEVMRLYPVVPLIDRQVLETFELGGYEIRRGSHLIISQYVMQRDPRFWPEPLKFDPDRWPRQDKLAVPRGIDHPFSYFPFGSGPLGCVASDQSHYGGVLILSMILGNWKFQFSPELNVEATDDMLHLHYPVPVKVLRRQTTAAAQRGDP